MKDGFQIAVIIFSAFMASIAFGCWMHDFSAGAFMFFLLESYYSSKLEV